jgi:hypothetical protein
MIWHQHLPQRGCRCYLHTPPSLGCFSAAHHPSQDAGAASSTPHLSLDAGGAQPAVHHTSAWMQAQQHTTTRITACRGSSCVWDKIKAILGFIIPYFFLDFLCLPVLTQSFLWVVELSDTKNQYQLPVLIDFRRHRKNPHACTPQPRKG